MDLVILLIVGVVLLIVGYMAPMPHPLPTLAQIAGWILTAIAGILLLVAFLKGGVEGYEAMSQLIQR